jgi:hypothetical protein
LETYWRRRSPNIEPWKGYRHCKDYRIDTGDDADLRLNPEKVIDTEKIIDTILTQSGEDADLTLNPEKIIDTD